MIRAPGPPPTSPPRKPRASGDDPIGLFALSIPFIVNPARAGMIRAAQTYMQSALGKPRASGDDPAAGKAAEQAGA